MTLGTYFYKLLVYPIEMILEALFYLSLRLFNNYGICIVFLSLFVNILVYPLYKKADDLQEMERQKQKEMEPVLKRIKKAFKGDERYFIQSAYYRENKYKPIYALRGSLSLFFQIPFFIAAYHFLSNLYALNDIPFLFINDLGKPDGLLYLGGVSVNLLPLLMTGINIVSSTIYSFRLSNKEKFQLYGVALVFLILLYNSPSGLVLYWTLNNFFSLIKNIYLSVNSNAVSRNRKSKGSNDKKSNSSRVFPNTDNICIVSLVMLTVFMGVYIPSTVVKAEPESFISLTTGPVGLLLMNLAVYTGLFLIWINTYYQMSSEKWKNIICRAVVILVAAVLIDFLFFGRKYGIIDQEFKFNNSPIDSRMEIFINAAVITVIVVFVLIVFKRFPSAVFRMVGILAVSIILITSVNVVDIIRKTDSYKQSHPRDNTKLESILPFYKKGKNVLFIMLDNAVGEYLPYALAEKPELMETFSGFTFYPNTVSYGQRTVLGSGALFGGYEYSIMKMNEEHDRLFIDKQKEAVSVLPLLFAKNGYDATMCSPPLVPISTYDQYDSINAYTLNSNYFFEEVQYYEPLVISTRLRNVSFYSLLKSAPVFARGLIYTSGGYMSMEPKAVSQNSIDDYFKLCSLPLETIVKNSEGCSFIAINNELPHNPITLNVPDYSLTLSVDPQEFALKERQSILGDRLLFNKSQTMNYHAFMASIIKLGEWLDYLKQLGVYDNTRIVIAADHGNVAIHQNSITVDGKSVDVEALNPLLMVKDFDSESFEISDEFMVNADVPYLLVNGIIDEPVNPFTGALISDGKKDKEDFYLTSAYEFVFDGQNVINLDDGIYYHVKGDIYDSSNWSVVHQKESPEK